MLLEREVILVTNAEKFVEIDGCHDYGIYREKEMRAASTILLPCFKSNGNGNGNVVPRGSLDPIRKKTKRPMALQAEGPAAVGGHIPPYLPTLPCFKSLFQALIIFLILSQTPIRRWRLCPGRLHCLRISFPLAVDSCQHLPHCRRCIRAHVGGAVWAFTR